MVLPDVIMSRFASRHPAFPCFDCSPQIIGGAIRPGHDARLRKYWNPLHHNLGKLSILVGWVMIYLGIWIYSVSIYGGSLLMW